MLRAIEFARDDAECLAAQSTTNRAELRSLGARKLRPTLQLGSQDLVLGGEIFIPQQQVLPRSR